MADHIKWIKTRTAVQLLIVCLSIFAGPHFNAAYEIQLSQIEASESGIPAGYESYLERPDILDLPAEAVDVDRSWQKMKQAHFSAVAELLALYSPDTEFYFLARDSEHLYDVARLVTENTAAAKRMHLLNVSRANMIDPNLKDYLKQEGISEETLSAGKKVLFIDTGFSGTIPRVIADNFPKELAAKLKTHLLVSANPAHPSSRAFLIHLNPSINDSSPSNMHGSIISYEHITRYTDRSDRFVLSNGHYHPISMIGKASDGSVSKIASVQIMTDLKAEWQKPETRQKFKAEFEQVNHLKSLLSEPSGNGNLELKTELEKNKNTPKGRLLEAHVRDILESKMTTGLQTATTLANLGLNAVLSQHSTKNILIQKYPEWSPILENPESKIPELFAEKKWQMIGNLIDANIDIEINGILLQSLYDAPAVGIKKDLQILMIEKGDAQTLQSMAGHVFARPHTKDMKDLLQLLIKRADAKTLSYLASFTFSKPHTSGMKDLLQLLIEKANNDVLISLAKDTFSHPHTEDMKDLLQLVIEKANNDVLQALAKFTFPYPHTKDMKDLLQLVIEKANNEVLQSLARSTFSQPHTKDMKDLIKILINKGNDEVLIELVGHVFSKPHAKDMEDLIKFAIEKRSDLMLYWLPSSVLSQPHSKNMTGMLKLLIEKADTSSLTRINFYFSGELNPEQSILKQSLKIENAQQRKEWIDSELAKTNSPLASVKLSAISSSLKTGDVVNIRGKNLRVLGKIGEGRRGVVFKVQAANGAIYALKTAKRIDAETLESFAKEQSKAKQWQELKIPHSKVLVQEKEYVLKTWISGLGGDQVIEKYSAGDMSYKAAADSLIALVAKIRAQGAYVGDFRPANMIWTGKAWVIIDSGSAQMGMTPEEAHAKWSRADERGPKFERRWQMPLPAMPKPNKCWMSHL